MNEELAAVFGIAGAVIAFILVIWLIVLAWLIVVYVFSSIAIYKLSSSRGYKNAWLAWIPLANNYVLGSIADSIDGYNGKKSYFRHILFWGQLVPFATSVIMGIVGVSLGIMSEASTVASNVAAAMSWPVMAVFYVISIGVPIAVSIVSYIVFYKIYNDYAPQNAVVFLVLSIFINVLPPFFLFAIRNKPSVSLSRAQGSPTIIN